MPKFIQIPTNTSPALADFLIGVSSGAVDQKTSLAVLAALFSANISAASIKNTQIDFTTAGKVWWEELGRTKLAVAGNSLSITGIPARRYIRLIQFTTGVAGSATGEAIRINNDSGANYDHRRSIASGASSLTQGDTKIDTYGDVAAQSFGIYDFVNDASANKPLFGTRMVGYPNGGTGTTWVYFSGVWRNASAAISRIDYLSSVANFAAGSEIIVLGHD